MYDALASLNPEDRSSVVYFADGISYVNRPELAEGPFIYAPTSNPNEFEAPDGTMLVLPPPDAESPFPTTQSVGPGTGPGYAVYSPPGYTYFQADVALPCSDMGLVRGETAFEYGGGISATGRQADVGITLTGVGATKGPPVGASPYLLVIGKTGNVRPVGDAHATFSCNQTIGMKFYITKVKGVATVVLHLSGRNNFGHPLTIMEAAGDSGWTPHCSTCKVKYVTSLVQSGPELQFGTWAGVTSPGTEAHQPDIEWSNISVAPSRRKKPTSVTGWTARIVSAGNPAVRCGVLHSGTPGVKEDVGIDASCAGIKLH